MKKVAIMAVAQNISNDIKRRFQECIIRSKPSVGFDVYLLGAKNNRTKGPFNKSKLLNKGIKKLVPHGYEVIIQADIDLVVPPGLVDKTYEYAMTGKVCFYNCHRRIDPEHLPRLPEDYDSMDWKKYMSFDWEAANGCWNGIQARYWMDTGGYNEDMIEWGKEDDDWRRRAAKFGKVGFKNWNKFCLIHVNHPQRTKDMRKRNRQCEMRSLKKGKWNWLT